MCGIAGIVDPTMSSAEIRSALERMAQALWHRGPDEGGFFVRHGAGLAIRRLSIIDVGGGHQPIGSEDGQIQVVLNGEIYNYLDLRSELIARGHIFRTTSDTEVIAHLYEEKSVGWRRPASITSSASPATSTSSCCSSSKTPAP